MFWKDWFNKNDIKDKDTLGPKQIAYLRRCNLKCLIPFVFLLRRQWGLFFAFLFVKILLVLSIVTAVALKPWLLGLLFGIAGVLFFLLLTIFLFYVAIRHERRLAWNRRKKRNFDHFRKVERRWNIVLLLVLVFYGSLQFLDLEKEMPSNQILHRESSSEQITV